MPSTWYSADPHYYHRNAIQLCDRPFASVEEMNEALVDRWNAVVRQDDTVWLLGDVTLDERKIGIVGRLNGHKMLAAGNHDTCYAGRKHPARAERAISAYYAAGFEQVFPAGVVGGHRIAGRDVLLSHLPYSGDSQAEDRFVDWRPIDCGLPLLHGHTHSRERVRGRQIHVGVDAWDYTPVHEEQVLELLESIGE